MKVRMLQSMVGPKEQRNVGEIIDVGSKEGNRLIEGGLAELVRNASKAEKAVK